MKNTDRTSSQGGQGQGSDKPTTRPTPSGVPNEGRGTDDQHGSVDQGARTGKGDYEYKGGRQGTGGIPNPDDEDENAERGVRPGQIPNEGLNSQPRNPK